MTGMERELEIAVGAVYGGPLETFVQRRDALVKELRSAGRKDDASAVKAMRKPSRLAWALDIAVLESGEALSALDAAVAALIDVHAAGDDARDAIAGLRSAVRELANRASRAAQQAGQRVDDTALANAVMAVLGTADAFDALHRGRLVDVPEAGGLDFLASLPARVPGPPPTAKPKQVAEPPARPDREEAAAREALRQARLLFDRASDEAERTQNRLAAVEAQLVQAEAAVRAARDARDRARADAESAAARRAAAERTLAEAESKLAGAGETAGTR